MTHMDEPWRAELDAMDIEVLAVQQMASHAFWPSVAIACAMIDKGLIEKQVLLKMVDALISYVSALTYGDLGDVENRTLALEQFRDMLEHTDLRPGHVLGQLQTLEVAAALSMSKMSKRQRRSRGKDEKS